MLEFLFIKLQFERHLENTGLLRQNPEILKHLVFGVGENVMF
jgi:hypothetical protein